MKYSNPNLRVGKPARHLVANTDPKLQAKASSLFYQAARAVGLAAPLTPDAQNAALDAFDKGPIVDQEAAARAHELAAELEAAGWLPDGASAK